MPEMGALGYPEFQLVTTGLGRSVETTGESMEAQIIFGLLILVVFAPSR